MCVCVRANVCALCARLTSKLHFNFRRFFKLLMSSYARSTRVLLFWIYKFYLIVGDGVAFYPATTIVCCFVPFSVRVDACGCVCVCLFVCAGVYCYDVSRFQPIINTHCSRT